MLSTFQRCFSNNWISPRKLKKEDLNYILCLSKELKENFQNHPQEFQDTKKANVALILQHPNVYVQAPAILGSQFLNVKLSTIIDSDWDQNENVKDVFAYLEKSFDVIFYQSGKRRLNLPTDFQIPLICVQCSYYKLLKCLADFMTISNHFNGLKGVKLAWIGPPTALFNSYLLLGPKLGLDISFYCAYCKKAPVTPALLNVAKKITANTHTIMKQCNSLQEAINGADVVATTCDVEADLKLSLEMLRRGNENWHVLTDLPRCTNEMDDDVFAHKNCLVWEALDNMKWVFSAFLLHGIFGREEIKKYIS